MSVVKRSKTWRRRRKALARPLSLEALQARFALDASLAGYVYIDVDGDGARSAGDIGVPGTRITLTGTTTSGESVNRTALTLNDGSYSFATLAPGTYQLTERQPSALADGPDTTSIAGAVTTNDSFSNIVLADGQHRTNSNFGEQYLRPEFVNIRWLFASAPPLDQLMRDAVARGEELAGNTTLAAQIRAANGDPPDDVNEAPVASNDSFQVVSGQVLNVGAASGVLANDSDPDGDNLTAQIVSQPASGTLTLNSNGSFTYTPNNDFSGTDAFTYRAHDGELLSNPATVTITVSPSVPEQALPDFTLTDVNPHSETHNEGVSPRDYLEQVSGWYFGHST